MSAFLCVLWVLGTKQIELNEEGESGLRVGCAV